MKCSVLLLPILMMSNAYGLTCSLNILDVNFGIYDVLATKALDSTGQVDVVCDARTSFSVSFSTGSGSYATRLMLAGPSKQLSYNLYRNAARNQVLGDGTMGTDVFSVNNARNRSFTVYGRVPALQNAKAGVYMDNIVVTLTF